MFIPGIVTCLSLTLATLQTTLIWSKTIKWRVHWSYIGMSLTLASLQITLIWPKTINWRVHWSYIGMSLNILVTLLLCRSYNGFKRSTKNKLKMYLYNKHNSFVPKNHFSLIQNNEFKNPLKLYRSVIKYPSCSRYWQCFRYQGICDIYF